jgi:hypothetical protein
MTLTQDILALHHGINEAFILEAREGRFTVMERGARDYAGELSNILNETTESSSLGLWVITGAAERFCKTQGPLELVGILYGDLGLILTNISEDKLLAVSTENSSLGDVMVLMEDQLPGLVKKSEIGAKTLSEVVEAERVARGKLAGIRQRFMAEFQGEAARFRVKVQQLREKYLNEIIDLTLTDVKVADVQRALDFFKTSQDTITVIPQTGPATVLRTPASALPDGAVTPALPDQLPMKVSRRAVYGVCPNCKAAIMEPQAKFCAQCAYPLDGI